MVDLQKARPRFVAIFRPAKVKWSKPLPGPLRGISFPSGHASNNFALAVVIAVFFPALGLAVFSVRRADLLFAIYVGSHYPSDILVAAIVGAGVACLVIAACDWLWRKFAARSRRVFSPRTRACSHDESAAVDPAGGAHCAASLGCGHRARRAGGRVQWLCAKRLDAAFFDAPAGTAALVRATTAALGDGALGLRVAFPLLAALASMAIFWLGRMLFGPAAGLWAAAALNALPVFNSAAVHADPALPALAFSLLAAGAFFRALERGPAWWLASGACLAIAENFAYVAPLLWLGFAAVCVLSPRHRAEWRKPGLHLALVLILAGLAPALAWNQSHGWPALALGTWRTVLTPRWAEIPSALGASAFLLGPPRSLAGFFRWARLGVRPGCTRIRGRRSASPRRSRCSGFTACFTAMPPAPRCFSQPRSSPREPLTSF